MMELTKEQICNKIEKLSRELTTYQAMLDQINVQEESEFSRNVKSMIGGYYMREFTDHRWYCHIIRANNPQKSGIEGLYAKCDCALVSIPKDSTCRYSAFLDFIYVGEYEVDNFKSITEGEFDAAVAQVNAKFKGQ